MEGWSLKVLSSSAVAAKPTPGGTIWLDPASVLTHGGVAVVDADWVYLNKPKNEGYSTVLTCFQDGQKVVWHGGPFTPPWGVPLPHSYPLVHPSWDVTQSVSCSARLQYFDRRQARVLDEVFFVVT